MSVFLIQGETLTAIANAIRSKTGSEEKMLPSEMVEQIETLSANSANTYILVAEDGTEIPAVHVEDEVVFTATANDIRSGTVAATAEGVTEGTKVIPAYHTTEGYQFIPVGSEVKITNLNNCEYTKLQVLLCVYNSTIAASVATEKVCIDGNVYAVGSTESVAKVAIDTANKAVSLGITNDGASPLIIRYFTYKEIY